MFFRVMLFVWPFVLDLVAALRMTDDEQDLEIMLLRQQLRIVERGTSPVLAELHIRSNSLPETR